MAAPAPSDLWLERSRFDGMILDGVSYGILFVLTVQCTYALMNKSQYAGGSLKTETRSRWLLLLYIFVTFTLATVGFAGNAKYSQMIWIDLRDSPGGPEELIINELGFWENRMALTSYYIMSWIMDVLLIHRCFIIWNWHVLVVIFMSMLLLANVVMAILTLVASSKGAVFTNINFQLAYLAISISTNFIYTILVAGRLLALRKQIRAALGEEHSKIYISVASMVVESSALYSAFGVLYVVTFALHNNVENLVFLWIIHGIAQLLIILRVAQGRAITKDLTAGRQSTSLGFAPPSVGQAVTVNTGGLISGTHTTTHQSSSSRSLGGRESDKPVVNTILSDEA
ncbi:hypothetical protein K439DRAFT_1337087 [Ramaria rubella]|nr:hypothetical protein K439DRAFT_1337087 [Ramaria rubella]